MPEIVDILQSRQDLPQFLGKKALIGIELGVASGDFSMRLDRTNLFVQLYGVDMYADHHNTGEYKDAVRKVGLGRPYWLLRMKFDQALDLFKDGFFDFVYIDGYAHTGEDQGRTLFEWWPKVKSGGMIAGHDYDPSWPGVVAAVDALADQVGGVVMRTAPTHSGPQDSYSSWAMMKQSDVAVQWPDFLGAIQST